MTDADIEYLVRALSEARSRATEITVSVRARVGVEHKLGELGNSAVSRIEMLLQEIRKFAVSDSDGGTGPVKAVSMAVPAKEGNAQIEPVAPSAAPLSPEWLPLERDQGGHWLHSFISEITERYCASGRITFEAVEEALRRHKQTVAKDIETTRRMYRTYPRLFPAEASRAAASGRAQMNGVDTRQDSVRENHHGL
jgi:hypothetical protein